MKLFKTPRKKRKEAIVCKELSELKPMSPPELAPEHKPDFVPIKLRPVNLRRDVPRGIGGLGGIGLLLMLGLTTEGLAQPGLVPPAKATANDMTYGTNNTRYVTPLLVQNAIGGLGGATNGIAMLNGFGTNTTLRNASLLAVTGTQGMVPWLDAGTGGFGFYVGGGNDAEEFFYFDDSTWVFGSNGVASARAQSFIGPLVGDLANATNLPPATGIAGWPANAYGHFVNNGSGTLSWESPLWWTNSAAASSVSNAFALKSTSVDVTSYVQRSGQFLLNSAGLKLGDSTTPTQELEVLGNGAFSGDLYPTGKLYFGATNGIIGIGSNLTVQAGILSSTATGSGSGGTVPTNTYHGSIVTSNNAATQAFDTGYSAVTNWTRTGPSYGVAGDIGAGTLTVSNAGTYVVGVALAYSTTTQPSDVYAEIFKNAEATGLRTHRDMTANNAHGSATILGLLTLVSNDVLSVQVLCAASETLNFGEAQLFVTTFGGETNVSSGGSDTNWLDGGPGLFGDAGLRLLYSTNADVQIRGTGTNFRLMFGTWPEGNGNMTGLSSDGQETWFWQTNDPSGLRRSFTFWDSGDYNRSHFLLIGDAGISIENSTDLTIYGTGRALIGGDAGVGGNLTVTNDLTVIGNTDFQGDNQFASVTSTEVITTAITNAAGAAGSILPIPTNAPVADYVLTASSATTAKWAAASGGGGTNAGPQWLSFSDTNVYINASTPAGAVTGGPLHFRLLMTTNALFLQPTNAPDGQRIVLETIQDGTGSRVAYWTNTFNFGDLGTVVLSTAANKRDFMVMIYNSPSNRWDVLSPATGY